jgi:hypothetical protein
MTRAILRELGAINVAEGSGWYFAPLARQAALLRLRGLVDGLPSANGARPLSLMLGQLDVVATRRQLARAAHRDFLGQLAAARQDLAALAEKPDGTVRAATVAARLADYRALKARARLYADLLQMQQEGIQRELDELAEQARGIVVKVAAGAGPGGAAAPGPPLPGLAVAG